MPSRKKVSLRMPPPLAVASEAHGAGLRLPRRRQQVHRGGGPGLGARRPQLGARRLERGRHGRRLAQRRALGQSLRRRHDERLLGAEVVVRVQVLDPQHQDVLPRRQVALESQRQDVHRACRARRVRRRQVEAIAERLRQLRSLQHLAAEQEVVRLVPGQLGRHRIARRHQHRAPDHGAALVARRELDLDPRRQWRHARGQVGRDAAEARQPLDVVRRRRREDLVEEAAHVLAVGALDRGEHEARQAAAVVPRPDLEEGEVLIGGVGGWPRPQIPAKVDRIDLGEARDELPQAVRLPPEPVAAAAVRIEDQVEVPGQALAARVVPDLERPEGHAAVGLDHVRGPAARLAVQQPHPRPVLRDVAVLGADGGDSPLPLRLEGVAGAAGDRVARLPEAVDEAVALVVPGQRQELPALVLGDQQVDFLEPVAVLGIESGEASPGVVRTQGRRCPQRENDRQHCRQQRRGCAHGH